MIHKKTILIVGAGIAGLTAGYFLHKHGYEVCILEARDRIGGRIFTKNNIDLGGQWGAYGLFTHKKRTATMIAKEDAVVLTLGYEIFRCFLIAFPESMFHLFGKTVFDLIKE